MVLRIFGDAPNEEEWIIDETLPFSIDCKEIKD